MKNTLRYSELKKANPVPLKEIGSSPFAKV